MNKFISKFKKGTQYSNIVAAVTSRELTKTDKVNESYLDKNCVKFIPASGAATRMFKDLYEYLEEREDTDFISSFFDNLEEFAFYEDIKEYIEINGIDKDKEGGKVKIIEKVLKEGLNYGNLPKALLKVHSYEEFSATPIDEHIFESMHYLDEECMNLHFTISKEHEQLFKRHIEESTYKKENINITYSFQKEKTDTIAVDMNDNPVLLKNGEALYRPGGHGALIENLNDLDADIIFIKNIDNVCHRNYIEDTVSSKKKLASIGIDVKEEIDRYVLDILSGNYDLNEIESFIKETLNIVFKNKLTKEKALSLLNRPLRVCGVVKNQGEPGGGPFIVDSGDYFDLQICEKCEIDLSNEKNIEILNSAEFFNPVDLVCFVRDYKDNKFDLLNYANEERYFISEKTHEGKRLKALEHPGLWNGAMDKWNTVFVEVPLSTFNPIKTVNDLLKDGHRDTNI